MHIKRFAAGMLLLCVTFSVVCGAADAQTVLDGPAPASAARKSTNHHAGSRQAGMPTASTAPGLVRIKDIADVQGVRGNQLIGFGLVVGLEGTGDGQSTLFSAQAV